MKKWGIYQWSIILFFLVIPIAATLIEYYVYSYGNTISTIAFKWFVFSGIGLRLGSSGIKQIIQPQFTAETIFKIKDAGAIPVVRELGFANVCFGILAVLSLFASSFRMPAAIAGGLYFGLAGMMHIFKKRESSEEVFAMVSDIFIFIVIVVLGAVNI